MENSWERQYHESLRAEAEALRVAAAEQAEEPMTYFELRGALLLIGILVGLVVAFVGAVVRADGTTRTVMLVVVVVLVLGTCGALWLHHRDEVLRRSSELSSRPPLPTRHPADEGRPSS